MWQTDVAVESPPFASSGEVMRYVRTKRVLAAALPAVLLAVGVTAVPASADSPDFYISTPAEGATITGTRVSLGYVNSEDCDAGFEPYWRIDGHEMDLIDDGHYGENDEQLVDSTQYTNGVHTFEASMPCDSWGEKRLTSTRQFIVRNVAPVVTVTSPRSDATVSGGSVTLNATAVSDPGGRQHVTQVEFFVDGESHGVDTLAPFESTFSSRVMTNGPHTVQAVANDSAGLVGNSVLHSFDVANFRSNLSIGTDRDRTNAGTPLTVVGTLGNINEGTPIAGKPVALYVRRADQSGWARVTTVTSNSAGQVAARHAPLFTSYYRLQYAGDASHSAAVSASVRVTVSPVVRLTTSTTSVRRGTRLIGAIKISPATGGQILEFSTRKVGGSWMVRGSLTSTPTATGFSLLMPSAGYYDLRILRKANPVGNAVNSNVVRIRVT